MFLERIYVCVRTLLLRPLIIDTQRAINYYASNGATWERAAYIKARYCAGDKIAAQEYLNMIAPFSYRRHLDFVAFDQIKYLRWRMINQSQQQKRNGIFIKTDRGGIRSIEFIVQALQLVWGGRKPILRHYNTLHSLDLLLKEQLIEQQYYDVLSQHYVFLRRVEHGLQMLNDEQTQFLPNDQDIDQHIAKLIGHDSSSLYCDVQKIMNELADIEQTLFPQEMEDIHAKLFCHADMIPEAENFLQQLGFIDTHKAYKIIMGWFSGQHKAFKTEKTQKLLHYIFNQSIALWQKETMFKRDESLQFLTLFFEKISHNLHFLSVIENYPFLLKYLNQISIISPFLGQEFMANPHFLEVFLEHGQSVTQHNDYAYYFENHFLERADYEFFLVEMRKITNGLKFSLASAFLTQQHTISFYQYHFAILAKAVVHKVTERIFIEQSDTSDYFAIIAFGSFGSEFMHYHSDLDIIFIYQAKKSQEQVDKKGMVFYNKIASRILTALQNTMQYGFIISNVIQGYDHQAMMVLWRYP